MADTKIDLKISEDLLTKVRDVAVSRFDARIHHISKKPEVTYTINKLIQIGLDALESGYQDNNQVTIPPNPDIESMVKEQLAQAIAEMEAKTAAKFVQLEAELDQVKKLELAA
ncbi:hypothetical protein IQ219_02495 [Synechocystis sp. LEGE 06083]|uniref:hypothetical protein n=1 Tax=Synechocystis sp. LEGE 06083 TaxID=915336 RepID=UPI0018817BE6|nr:hypothetical protein [Synechocystis sp. LEGE 06083]MBE9194218.1 hypothetical protein [Synechocystis sp. LEGE 06083]